MKHKLSSPLRAGEIQARIAKGEVTAEVVVQRFIDGIAELEPALRAWKFFDPELALVQARALDQRLSRGDRPGLLAGVPIGVKDIFDTVDMPTGCGSVIYEGHRPTEDALLVAASRNAGAVVMGKTVTTEFAYFTPGPTANPWNTAHTPGGSSSGSAAAVASGMVPLAFGSQTAGSLIRPASYCGVFAIKPTFGMASTRGIKAFSESLDTPGWMASNADDLELMRAALAGEAYQPLATASSIRLAGCRTHEASALDASGEAAWDTAHRRLSLAGVAVEALVLPERLRGLMQAQKTVMAYEAARSLAFETSEHAADVSRHIHELVETGRRVSLADYQAAQALATQARQEVVARMAGVDAILAPAAPGEAPEGLAATGDPIFSRVWTLLGLPCVNVPGLLGPRGLPIGMQLVGRPGDERRLLSTAAAVHQVLSRAS